MSAAAVALIILGVVAYFLLALLVIALVQECEDRATHQDQPWPAESDETDVRPGSSSTNLNR